MWSEVSNFAYTFLVTVTLSELILGDTQLSSLFTVNIERKKKIEMIILNITPPLNFRQQKEPTTFTNHNYNKHKADDLGTVSVVCQVFLAKPVRSGLNRPDQYDLGKKNSRMACVLTWSSHLSSFILTRLVWDCFS